MKTGARTMNVRVRMNGTYELLLMVRWYGPKWPRRRAFRGKEGCTNEGGLFLGGVAAQRVPGDFDCRAYDHAGKEPGAVFDDSEVEESEEDDAVEDCCEDGKRQGWRIHPD
jgi:hypothetical protein